MEFERSEGAGPDSGCAETAFEPVQIDLPVFACKREPCAGMQPPCELLAEYLKLTGVHQPGETARDLLNEFGSLSGLLTASRWKLRSVAGTRLADTIDASRTLVKASLLDEVKKGPLVPRTRELIDLLQIELGFLDYERVLALYVDSKARLIDIRQIAEGGWDSASASNRKIIQYAFELGAWGFILVHNHPSGIPRASDADLDLTARLRRLAADLDIRLVDHLIIARGRFGSVEDFWREARWSK